MDSEVCTHRRTGLDTNLPGVLLANWMPSFSAEAMPRWVRATSTPNVPGGISSRSACLRTRGDASFSRDPVEAIHDGSYGVCFGQIALALITVLTRPVSTASTNSKPVLESN